MFPLNVRRVLWLVRTRWYLALVAVLVLAGAFATAFAFYPAKYTSQAVLVVTTPDNGGRISADPRTGNDITNPLFNFSSGQNIAAQILIASANAPDAQQRLETQESGTSYVVSDGNTNPEASSTGPFIYVDATASTASAASDTSAAVVRYIRGDLQTRQVQVGAPPATFLSVLDVVSPTPPTQQVGNRLVAATVAALFCLLVASAIIDRLDRTNLRSGDGAPPVGPGPTRGRIDADTETLSRSALARVNGQRRHSSPASSPNPRPSRAAPSSSSPSPHPRLGPS